MLHSKMYRGKKIVNIYKISLFVCFLSALSLLFQFCSKTTCAEFVYLELVQLSSQIAVFDIIIFYNNRNNFYNNRKNNFST